MDPYPSLIGDQFMMLQVAGFVIALLLTALFSFLETSITALRLFRLKELAKELNGSYSTLLAMLEKNPHQVLVTILIADSLASTTCAALITHLMEELFSRMHLSGSIGFSVGVGIATIAIMIFGEIIPKNIARSYGERLLRSTLWLMNLSYIFLHPIVNPLVRFSNFVVTLISPKTIHEGTESVVSEKELEFLIDYLDEKGIMKGEKIDMLQSIFDLSQTQVREIMVPATDIISISIDSSLNDALSLISEYNFSRLPVYEGKQDNIVGLMYQKDIFHLLSHQKQKAIRELIRPILFVPETIKVDALLRELKEQRVHMVMVVNEYGSIQGLVTLEDVLEEIVGEISDEHESAPEKIIPLKQGGWLVEGNTTLAELSEAMHIPFEQAEAITLGGFLIERLRHLPRKGERIYYKNYCFQVQNASPTRVKEVLVFQEHATNLIIPSRLESPKQLTQ